MWWTLWGLVLCPAVGELLSGGASGVSYHYAQGRRDQHARGRGGRGRSGGGGGGGRNGAQVYRRLEPSAPIQCFSCMNMAFKHHWHRLKYFYYPQKNFTDDCVGMRRPMGIPRVQCAHSLCISLFEPRYIAGYFAGHNVVRGCLSNLFQFGHQRMSAQIEDVMASGSTRDFCSTTSATEIFPPVRREPRRRRRHRLSRRRLERALAGRRPKRQSRTVATRPIKYCVCVGSHCNTAASTAAQRTVLSSATALLCLALAVRSFTQYFCLSGR